LSYSELFWCTAVPTLVSAAALWPRLSEDADALLAVVVGKPAAPGSDEATKDDEEEEDEEEEEEEEEEEPGEEAALSPPPLLLLLLLLLAVLLLLLPYKLKKSSWTGGAKSNIDKTRNSV
jgi:H+/gluconate symporter-like permease